MDLNLLRDGVMAISQSVRESKVCRDLTHDE